MAKLIQASSIVRNLAEVKARMDEAAHAAGRNPQAVTLVAVSKTQPASALSLALEAGQRIFGENRVQEAEWKFAPLKERWPDISLHMIGPLQTNKVRAAVGLFDAIHSVDRPRLAAALGEEMRKQGRRIACFIEVNIGQEPQKSGIAPGDLDAFLASCREQYGLPVAGLMCIPPAAHDPVPYFRQLAALAKKGGVSCLSMGMSADFTSAIAAGATHIRVGNAIFGARG